MTLPGQQRCAWNDATLCVRMWHACLCACARANAAAVHTCFPLGCSNISSASGWQRAARHPLGYKHAQPRLCGAYGGQAFQGRWHEGRASSEFRKFLCVKELGAFCCVQKLWNRRALGKKP
jgi:hypothetical protein